ncbi:replication/maintenance protein RepL [Lacibacter sp. MH-610]|uniref:replication/maintenance protein RepL n=1 Tax=Lacibacter sp. MH-610 TaxID=3020883 RepID=UPI0038926D62
MGKKVVYRQKTVDHETGEVTESVSVTMDKQPAPQYCSFFMDAVPYMKLIGAMEKDVLFQMVKYLEWNTNMVFANEHNRIAIAYDLGLKPNSVGVAIRNMKKKNILRRVRNTVYWINPNILFYGTLVKREEMLKSGIDWEIRSK